MRKHFTALSLLFMMVFSVNAVDISIPFQESDFETVRAEAIRQNKPFFVFYYGKGCVPCEMMKESTFGNTSIVEMVNKDFIAAKVKLNSDLGQEWKSKSKASVVFLPTIIFFSPQGEFINKYENWIKSDDFKKILEKNLQIGRIMSKNAPSTSVVHTVPPKVYTVPKTVDQDKPTTKVLLAKTSPVEKESFKTPAQKLTKIGTRYVVQLSVFSKTDNIDSYIEEMKLKTNMDNIYMIEDDAGKRKMYRVITGQYDNVKDALELVETLKIAGVESFVKKI